MNDLKLRQAKERLEAAESEGLTATEVCERIIEVWHSIIQFDYCAVMTTDPETMLPSGGTVEGFAAEHCAPFWDTEFIDPDFNKFATMVRSLDTVATLAEATDGELCRSLRYQKLYAPLAPADELRAVFVANGSCLAVGVFLRPSGSGPFSDKELARVQALVPVATTVLQRALGRVVHETVSQPVVILLDGADNITGMTPGVKRILDDLRTSADDTQPLPGVVQVAIMKARRGRSGVKLTTRVRSQRGRWLRLHVAPLEGEPEAVASAIAVSIDSARSDDLVPILLESYALTERETDIVLLLCRGLAAKEIAEALGISPHTVRDHSKSIYEKTGVNSRGELVARLFSAHVLDRFHDSITRVA